MLMAATAAACTPNNKPMSNRFMGAQKEIWHLEQEIVNLDSVLLSPYHINSGGRETCAFWN
jgi:hypothetical protein